MQSKEDVRMDRAHTAMEFDANEGSLQPPEANRILTERDSHNEMNPLGESEAPTSYHVDSLQKVDGSDPLRVDLKNQTSKIKD